MRTRPGSSGMNAKGIIMLCFVLAGVMAGFGSILMAARLNSGSPNYGVGMELSAIAAAVIGGASLQGGKGNVISTLFGALTITIVQNGLNLHAVETSVQGVVIGLIIMLAVFIDMWRVEMWSAVSRLGRMVTRDRAGRGAAAERIPGKGRAPSRSLGADAGDFMAKYRVYISDFDYPDNDIERAILEPIGAEVIGLQCRTAPVWPSRPRMRTLSCSSTRKFHGLPSRN